MSTIERFTIRRSSGRDLRAVRRPQRLSTPKPATTSLDGLTKAELAALAESKGLDTSGTKAELTERLGSVQ